MLVYFKKYVIALCALAVALPVIASTIWPLATGQLMASTLGGLILEFALFIGGFLVGYQIFSRRAERVADGFVYLYNVDCNPEAFLNHGSELARSITYPCNPSGAWYLGYYAQACLDVGRMDEAKAIEEGLRASIAAQKKPQHKCSVIIALIPLVEKTGTLQEVRSLVEEGLTLIASDASSTAEVQRIFLTSQQKIADARMASNLEQLKQLDDLVVSSSSYPMRIRVEFAWDAASASYKLGKVEDERQMLAFIIQHGGTLALVAHARKRLDALEA